MIYMTHWSLQQSLNKIGTFSGQSRNVTALLQQVICYQAGVLSDSTPQNDLLYLWLPTAFDFGLNFVIQDTFSHIALLL